MSTRPLCIFHADCADGFTAAWIVNRYFGDGEVDFHPGVYGRAPPDCVGRDVLIVDFSYKRPVLEAMAATAHSVFVLDHHKTAFEDLTGVPTLTDCLEWIARRHTGPSHALAAVFDMNRSGAQITWDFLFDNRPRPPLVDYVADRDLWRFNLPRSRDVNAYIAAHDYEFGEWEHLQDMLQEGKISSVAATGAMLNRRHMKAVRDVLLTTQRSMVIGGHLVPVANMPFTMASDAGQSLAHGAPFGAVYWDTAAGRVFSLRSLDGGLDVSEIAKAYGGGGHARAAGFTAATGWEGDTPAFGWGNHTTA